MAAPRFLLTLLSLGSLYLAVSSFECTKLKRNRKNPFSARGEGRLVTFTIRKAGVLVGTQNLGNVFFVNKDGEPMYGVEMIVSQSPESEENRIFTLNFMTVIRRGRLPCNDWPGGLTCITSDTSGDLEEKCVLEFPLGPVFQDMDFEEDGEFFKMSINGVPMARVGRPHPDCLARKNNWVEQILYQGDGASHLYSCH